MTIRGPDLLEFGGHVAEALERVGYTAVARKRDGVVMVEYWKMAGARQYMMRHVVSDGLTAASDVATQCDAEFRAAIAHYDE